MHFNSHPAWRYQWSAVAAIVAMGGIAALMALYDPAHLGSRITDLVFTALGALALYFVLLMLYRRYSWRYVVDDRNIESYHGVLARHVHSIRIEDLRNINVNQTVVQRLLGVGDVEFSSAASGDIEVVFFGVSDPMQIKVLVQRMQRSAPLAEDP